MIPNRYALSGGKYGGKYMSTKTSKTYPRQKTNYPGVFYRENSKKQKKLITAEKTHITIKRVLLFFSHLDFSESTIFSFLKNLCLHLAHSQKHLKSIEYDAYQYQVLENLLQILRPL